MNNYVSWKGKKVGRRALKQAPLPWLSRRFCTVLLTGWLENLFYHADVFLKSLFVSLESMNIPIKWIWRKKRIRKNWNPTCYRANSRNIILNKALYRYEKKYAWNMNVCQMIALFIDFIAVSQSEMSREKQFY